MSRAKRQKIDRENLAAYSASQPLFDTLRNATSKLTEQEAHLTTARDVVQTLHVKIANNDDHLKLDRHNRYMDAAVKAWQSATETYCTIFEQLVTITAADPTEGKEQGLRHEEFKSLLESARKADETVKSFAAGDQSSSEESDEDEEEEEAVEPAAKPNGTGKRPMMASENESGSAASEEAPKSSSKAATQPLKPSALTEDIRYDRSGTKILWQDGALKVSYTSLQPDEKRAWDVIKHRSRRKGRLARLKGQKKAQQEQNNSTEARPQPEPAAEVPAVEYEDVSAEVEARLKAKAEKKAAQKAKSTDKKRKRESGDSVTAVDSGIANAGGDEGVEPVENVEGPSKEKPEKKKAKKSQGVEDETKPTTAGAAKPKAQPMALSKRKKPVDADVAEKAGEGSGKANKKRKKNNV